MSQGEPLRARDDDLNPHMPGSDAWLDPGVRRIHDPPPIILPPPGTERMPLWPTVLLALPVGVAILAMDPRSGWLIQVGWIPLLIAVCAYLGWWHLIRRR